MTKSEKLRAAAGVFVLVAVFAAIFAAFYINRDIVYRFLRGGASENENGGRAALGPSRTPSEYFSDIVFIGDSIVAGLEVCKDYAQIGGEKILKDATIIAAPSYSLSAATTEPGANAVNLIYEGKAMRPEDIIADINEKYVFICLGLNDLSWSPLDAYIENYRKLIENIRAKSPDVKIAILSVTPLVASQRESGLTNAVIAKANDRLAELAGESSVFFVDWARALQDESGALPAGLSSDGYCHLKAEAYVRLVEYLINNPAG